MKISEIIAFILILVLQIVFVNNMGLILVTPMIYLYIIIKLPFSINSLYVLLIAFFLGVLFDLSVMTPGVQSFTMSLTAFLRIPIRNLFLSKDLQANMRIPVLSMKENKAYLLYTMMMIVIYYFIWQLIDGTIRLSLFKFISNIVLGSIITFGLMLLFDRIFYAKKQKTIA